MSGVVCLGWASLIAMVVLGLAMGLSGATDKDAGYDLFAPVVAGLIYLGYATVLLTAATLVVPQRDVG